LADYFACIAGAGRGGCTVRYRNAQAIRAAEAFRRPLHGKGSVVLRPKP
jgi:hypothetical protein